MNDSLIQIDKQGNLKHLLSIDGLSKNLLLDIIDNTNILLNRDGGIKREPLLQDVTICNLFFENSTRTQTTFELAERNLHGNIITLNISTSSQSKGEILLDTVSNLESMGVEIFVIRHNMSGVPHLLCQHILPNTSIINAGDGCHSHPTQSLVDMLTIHRHRGEISKLSVAIVGDFLHSRVARSDISSLKILGCKDIRVAAPKTLLPLEMEVFGVSVYHNISDAIKDVDVIIMLRLQHERMNGSLLPSEKEFHFLYGLTAKNLSFAKPNAIVMHPGPINRDVEIESSVADGPQSVISNQVSYGTALRMVIFTMIMKSQTFQKLDKKRI